MKYTYLFHFYDIVSEFKNSLLVQKNIPIFYNCIYINLNKLDIIQYFYNTIYIYFSKKMIINTYISKIIKDSQFLIQI